MTAAGCLQTTCALCRIFRRSSAAVATSREGHRLLRPAVRHGSRNGGDFNAANRDGLRSGNAMRVFVQSPIGGKSKELLSVFADERIARLVAEHLIRGSLVVPPTGDVQNVIQMAREAARIGRLLMSEQVRSVTYTLEEREALVLVNTIALWTAEP
jgi:hypothetical protein